MSKDCTPYLQDIIKALQATMASAMDITYEEFMRDKHRFGFVKDQIQTMGEASTAKNIPQNIKEQYEHLKIPWKTMINMRNTLIHEYDRINYPSVWKMITQIVPEILPKVQTMFRLEEKRMQELGITREERTASTTEKYLREPPFPKEIHQENEFMFLMSENGDVYKVHRDYVEGVERGLAGIDWDAHKMNITPKPEEEKAH